MPGQTRMKFTVPITHALVPSFNLLVFFACNDGEIVADFVEVKVECDLKEKVKEKNLQISVNGMFYYATKVNIYFSKESAQPGDNITVEATADADTPILVGIIDTSLTFLSESCKSLQSTSVCIHYMRVITIMAILSS